jgi:hypothetical protein
MWRILAIPFVAFLAGSAQAQENVTLKAGPGRGVVESYCNACHSLDYLTMNAPFLDRQGWETEVNKMARYLARQSGQPILRSLSTIS